MGVRQRGLSSRTLFSIYINDLIVAPSNDRGSCHIHDVCVNNISYTDGMVLLSASTCALRKLAAMCETYAKSLGLIYNIKKREVMAFGVRNRYSVPLVYRNDVPLKRVHSFSYLGHMLTSDLRGEVDIERNEEPCQLGLTCWHAGSHGVQEKLKLLFSGLIAQLFIHAALASYTRKAYSAL